MAKEELRIRKDVVEETEVVEEDVRREKVDVENAAKPRRGRSPETLRVTVASTHRDPGRERTDG